MDLTYSTTYHITKTGNLLRQLTAKRIKDAGVNLTPEEAVLLNQLWDADQQTITELGHWSIKDSSTLTRQIDGLEKKGYVQRVPSSKDRRKVLICLTKQGKSLETLFATTNLSQLDEDIAQLDPAEQEIFLKVLTRIRENALRELCKI